MRKLITLVLQLLLLAGVLDAQITERERPPAWDKLSFGGRFMDRLLPIPVMGSLSSDTWGADNVIPRYVDNGLEDMEWSYWGGNALKGADGNYHLYVCRWREDSRKGHMEWPRSLVVHAVADNPLGPYRVQETVGKGHNPEIFRLQDGRYVIYVIGGYYIADTLAGPWEYAKFTFDPQGKPIIEGLSNLSFAKRHDGSYLMVCRGGGIWISDDGLSTYRQVSPESVYPKVEGRFEDPVLWRTHIQYHMIVNDWYGRIAYYLRSKDGLQWKVDPGEAYLPGIARYEDGTVEDWFKYERMKVLQDELGRATQAHFAVIDTLKHEDRRSDRHSSKHICIPLAVGRQLEILNREVIDCHTDSIKVQVRAEEGFDPHKDMDFSTLRFGAPEEVNYGFGSQLLDVQDAGKDLVLVFEGKGNGLSERNFTTKLLGRDREGKLLFGYARLPWVNYPDAPATVFAESGAIANSATSSTEDYDTIRVEDFGARVNSRQNVTGMVKAALEEARKLKNPLLLFEKGRYDFWPQYSEERVYYESNTSDINPKRLGILVEGFERLVIDGGGADFVFHDRMQPITVDHSTGVELRNFTIDWDIPLTAQAEVLEVQDQSMLLRIDREESPFVIEEGKIQFVGEGWKSPLRSIMEIERGSRLIAPQTGDPGCCGRGWDWANWVEEEPGLVRVHKPFAPDQRPDPGNYLILRHSYRDHAGIFIFHSRDTRVEHVEVYHTAGLGILSQFSENISMHRVKMVPNLKKNRYLSGHDDGFHFSNCRGQIFVSHCEFAALMDDPINIHGTSVRVMEKLGDNKLRCRFMHHQSVGLQWGRQGEEIGFLKSASMQTMAMGIVKDFQVLSPEEFEISFEEPVPGDLEEGDALENLSWTPDAHIHDNRFLSCRARGLLVSTPGRVLIENNHFESSGSAILIAGDANNWYETGAVKDVTIRNNVFAAPCLTSLYQFSEAVISIFPEIPDPEASKEKYHRNIRILDNEFHLYDYPVLYAASVDGLEFKGNQLIRSHRFPAFHPRKYGFSLLSCRNVEITGNSISEELLGKTILLEGTKSEDLQLGDDQDLEIIY
jgi:hypothetical protein